MSANLRLLMVEDSPTDAKLVVEELRRAHLAVDLERVESEEGLRVALGQGPWDAVLCDWELPAFSAMRALAMVRSADADLPFIIVSGVVDEEQAVVAMRAGAHDYLRKDKLARLAPALERETRDSRARRSAAADLRASEARLRDTEAQLRHAQKMEAIGRLAGGVAHDFNNILSVIISYTDMALEDLGPMHPRSADLEEVRRAAARASALTRQLLLFSRQQVVVPEVTDLYEVVARMERMLQRIVGEDVELVLSPQKVSGRVKVGADHIEQILMNLVVNARDAMPIGGRVLIETANVSLDAESASGHLMPAAGEYVMLAVTDTGAGMNAATQARAFEPFFTTKGQGKGTGLGLSTVFGIVQQSGGSIWVYSEVGRGTTFKVYLPRVDEDAHVLRPAGEPRTLRGTETILVVDDEAQVRDAVRSVLARYGYRLLVASGPSEALVQGENYPENIDLLVTDVVMPEMSGPVLAKRFLARRPDVKLLYMSGYTDDSVLRHGVLEAGVAFIQKPIVPSLLARQVRSVLDGEAGRLADE